MLETDSWTNDWSGWDGSFVEGARPLPDYRLHRFRGRGGFGKVWEAEVTPGGNLHALKFVKADEAGGALEIRALEIYKGVNHSNLINVINYWPNNRFPNRSEYLIIAMELGQKTLEQICHEES